MATSPPLVIGSVKGNIGHAEGAAGIAGFIKACLSIHHRRVPPSLTSEDENPALALADRGLKLALTPEKLPLGTAVGGVSSFGLGGSNVHVVVGSVPRQRSPMRPDRMGGIGVLTVSGNDAAAVDRNLDVLVQNFSGREQWPRYCYSTNQVKAGGSLRIALVARGRDDLQSKALIAKRLLAQHDRNSSRSRHPRIGFLYTGQGSQYPTMAMALRDDHPGFASALEDADKLLFPFFGGSVVQAIDRGEDHQGRSLDNTAVAQPALFAVQYALTQTFAAHGVRPEIVLGHSVGEIAACVAAGIISPGDAAALVVRRGALMSSIPAGGAMLAAQIPTDDAMKFIGGPVSLAAINGRANVVFSGPTDQINDIEDRLNTSGVRTRRLPVSYAFHSPAMTPIADELAAVAPKPKTGTGVKMISTVDGTVIGPDMLVGEYWRKQLLCAVDFYAAAKTLEAEAPTHLIEIGPQAILLGLLKTTDVAMNSVRAAPIPGKAATGLDLAGVLAQLWQSGMEINWPAMYMESDRAVCRLPSYAFADNERFFTSAATTAYSRFVQDIDAVTHSSSNDARGHAAPVSKQSEVAFESVHHTIIRVLAEITGHQEDALHPTVDLRDDLGFDSVQAMQFADRIAAELAIPHLDPGALQASLATVADLTNLVTGAASR
ncbi:acyltransferase domain-containing protein [Mycobacterium montefiorense]|nr:acyltransferase domain-containing protein [Mycobacterium montefiorense]